MYKAEISNSGGSSFKVKTGRAELIVDTNGQGITPPAVFLASLGSCIGVYLRKYIDGAKLPVPSFSVTIEGELDKKAPVSFRYIKATVGMGGYIPDERRKSAILDFVKNCPIHNTIKLSPRVDIVIS
jgi:uncharacterized OsmC-like protein